MTRGFVLGSALGLAVGVIGSLAIRGLPADGGAAAVPNAPASTAITSGEGPRLAGAPPGTKALQARLDSADLRIQQLTAELEAARQRASAVGPPAVRQKEDALPAAVREEAARLGVSDKALDAMWRARNVYYWADPASREEMIASLRPFGDEALRAVAAITRGGGGHVSIPLVLAKLGLPGGGDRIIRMIEEDPKHLSPLLEALAGYDTPGVRDYLVDRIARESDPGVFWKLAAALGALHEARGAEVIRIQQFLGPTWVGVRGYILGDIGRMGGPAALRLLEDYLLLPNADHLGAALGALAELDRERARSHARRIRQSDRYGFLDVGDRPQVDALASEG